MNIPESLQETITFGIGRHLFSHVTAQKGGCSTITDCNLLTLGLDFEDAPSAMHLRRPVRLHTVTADHISITDYAEEYQTLEIA